MTMESPDNSCTCHGDKWLTHTLRMEHETTHYKQMLAQKEQDYRRLYELIEFYNGDPLLMLAREREIKKRRQWCMDKEMDLKREDVRLIIKDEFISRREVSVSRRERQASRQEEMTILQPSSEEE